MLLTRNQIRMVFYFLFLNDLTDQVSGIAESKQGEPHGQRFARIRLIGRDVLPMPGDLLIVNHLGKPPCCVCQRTVDPRVTTQQ